MLTGRKDRPVRSVERQSIAVKGVWEGVDRGSSPLVSHALTAESRYSTSQWTSSIGLRCVQYVLGGKMVGCYIKQPNPTGPGC